MVIAAGALVTIELIASAKPTEPPAAAFVRFGSEVSYHAVVVPLATKQLGSAAAAIADGKQPPRVRGRLDAALADSWLKAGLGKAGKRGSMPLAAKPRVGKCKCATEIGTDSKGRIAALYVEARFQVPSGQIIELLELRARYGDGLIAAINGREVLRRNIGSAALSTDSAARPRGPEPESFFIPVSPGLLKSGENTIRLEMRPSGHRISPRLDFELTARRGSRVVRGPIVMRDDKSVTIAFDTDLPVVARVDWGRTAELGQTQKTAGGALAVRHKLTIPIASTAAFSYRIAAGSDTSQVYQVARQPVATDVVRFGVYGDMRGGHATHAKIVAALEKEAPDFVVVTGDLVLRGSDGGDWQRFFQVAKGLLARVPYYPAAGNHDTGHSGEERRLMTEHFPLPASPEGRPEWGSWYSVDIAGIHFVMLDSNSYRHEAQLDWLEKDLTAARTSGVRAIFAATHDGPYSRGIHRGNRYAAANYAPVLAKHKVSLLFSGHDHLYQRGKVGGLRYIVSGGGGAPLYPVRCGVRGRRRCKVDDGMRKVESAFHYVIVQVFTDYARVCPKRPSREALEPCFRVEL